MTITLNGLIYELTHIARTGDYLTLTLVPFVGKAITLTLPIIAIEADLVSETSMLL